RQANRGEHAEQRQPEDRQQQDERQRERHDDPPSVAGSLFCGLCAATTAESSAGISAPCAASAIHSAGGSCLDTSQQTSITVCTKKWKAMITYPNTMMSAPRAGVNSSSACDASPASCSVMR